MRRTAGLVLALTIAGCPADLWAQTIHVRWAFGAMTGSGGARHFLPITDEATLDSGDELKMYVSPVTRCFVYVVHQGPDGAFDLLFPADARFDPGPLSAGSAHYIPADTSWLQLDAETGIERVYLIVSTTKLTTLEHLLEVNASSLPGGKAGSARALITEIARLQREFVGTKWSERPVTIGGQIRGREPISGRPDVARNAVEFSGTSAFFYRAFIINHR